MQVGEANPKIGFEITEASLIFIPTPYEAGIVVRSLLHEYPSLVSRHHITVHPQHFSVWQGYVVNITASPASFAQFIACTES